MTGLRPDEAAKRICTRGFFKLFRFELGLDLVHYRCHTEDLGGVPELVVGPRSLLYAPEGSEGPQLFAPGERPD